MVGLSTLKEGASKLNYRPSIVLNISKAAAAKYGHETILSQLKYITYFYLSMSVPNAYIQALYAYAGLQLKAVLSREPDKPIDEAASLLRVAAERHLKRIKYGEKAVLDVREVLGDEFRRMNEDKRGVLHILMESILVGVISQFYRRGVSSRFQTFVETLSISDEKRIVRAAQKLFPGKCEYDAVRRVVNVTKSMKLDIAYRQNIPQWLDDTTKALLKLATKVMKHKRGVLG